RLSTAAPAVAAALSGEVRHAGVDLLVDPGTYCYHGEPQWRSYFRSTRAHNTLELDGTSQALESGPFMWSGEVRTVEAPVADATRTWHGRHLGYTRLAGSPVVER